MYTIKEKHEVIKIMAIKPIISDEEIIDWKKLNEETK